MERHTRQREEGELVRGISSIMPYRYPSSRSSSLGVTKTILSNEGLRGMYRGYWISVATYAPYRYIVYLCICHSISSFPFSDSLSLSLSDLFILTLFLVISLPLLHLLLSVVQSGGRSTTLRKRNVSSSYRPIDSPLRFLYMGYVV
jgi:hypothetical protein